MDNLNYLKRDLDDIVFEGRNQSYGAYVIRKAYTKHIQRATLFGFAFFALIIASPSIAESMKKRDNLIMTPDILLPPPPFENTKPLVPKPPVPPKPETPKPIATVKFVPPVVREDNVVKEPDNIPKMDEITSAVSDVDRKGVEGDLPPDMTPTPPPVGSDEGEGKKVEKVEDDQPFILVEQQPEFPEGLKAMYLFLRNNMIYPSIARESGIEGNVYVGFVVGKDGKIRNITIKRGIGGGCNEEAARVVALMPKWNPGKQNGKAVSVAYTLPIKFKLE
jgi:periplasmic protein TonB